MICGLPKCKKPAHSYGVCKQHKAWYFVPDDTEFEKQLAVYKQCMVDLEKESESLNDRGINLLDIQACWDNDLGKKRLHDFPEHFKIAGELMEKMDEILRDMQSKYDPTLVYNCTTRARHQSCSVPCRCMYCRLVEKTG